LIFLKRELKFYYDIPIILVDDVDFSKNNKTFGMMYPDKIVISIVNRHPLDILRTVAHEYIHHKQQREGKNFNGNAGSVSENEANAKAGEIIRKYSNFQSDLFDLMPIR
jgi:Zn-dependent peptidase ImmA (M78 family)